MRGLHEASPGGRGHAVIVKAQRRACGRGGSGNDTGLGEELLDGRAHVAIGAERLVCLVQDLARDHALIAHPFQLFCPLADLVPNVAFPAKFLHHVGGVGMVLTHAGL